MKIFLNFHKKPLNKNKIDHILFNNNFKSIQLKDRLKLIQAKKNLF